MPYEAYAHRFTGFSGLVPRFDARGIADNQAQIATNCRLTSGRIHPTRQPLLAHNPGVSGLQSIFTNKDAAKWLTFTSDTNVAKGPLPNDTGERLYWTGPGEPRMSKFADATSGGGPYPTTQYVLGVTTGIAGPTVGITGGSGATETRSYVYTLKTQFGEEGPPSPPGTATGFINGTWNLTVMPGAPRNSFTVTGASWAAGIATYTVATNALYELRVGEYVTISGMTPSGYNVTNVPITAVTATTVAVAIAVDPGAFSAGGTIARIAPHNTTSMTKEIHRTITATSGQTEYRFVASIAIATTTYDDSIASSVVALATRLPSQPDLLDALSKWSMPPTDLRGILHLGNGIMVGFAKNDIYFSEAYKPHAWPVKYRQSADYAIVGIGAYGTTVVIGTTGTPYIISGVEPATMGGGMQGLKQSWPCLAKRGMASSEFGVAYPTKEGQVLIGPGAVDVFTRDFYTQEEWTPLNPETFTCAWRDRKLYIGFLKDATQQMIQIDRTEFASVTSHDTRATCLWTNPESGILYAVIDNVIYEMESRTAPLGTFYWKSKEMVLRDPLNLSAFKIDGVFSQTAEEIAAAAAARAAAIAANVVILTGATVRGASGDHEATALWLPSGGVNIGEVPAAGASLNFELFINGVVKFARTVNAGTAFKGPGGYRADNYAVQISGNVPIRAILAAETMTSLEKV
jgi:hypothetical protein